MFSFSILLFLFYFIFCFMMVMWLEPTLWLQQWAPSNCVTGSCDFSFFLFFISANWTDVGQYQYWPWDMVEEVPRKNIQYILSG